MSSEDLLDVGLREALAALLPGWSPESAEPLGRGHIHRTLCVSARHGERRARFVVQRVNTRVFRDPETLAGNLARVTAHVRASQRARGVSDPERRCLRLVESPAGDTLHRASDDSCWRAFPFVEGTRALAGVPASPGQARDAARAFGAFLADLEGLDPAAVSETLPRFHDFERRLAALVRAAAGDAAGRAASVTAEIEALERLARRLGEAPGPALPRRVVHNDCKLDNLLVDEASGEPLCVVDLDTVMPGHAWYDFGELVRTGACPGPEDGRDPASVRFDPALFRALAAGFVEGARGRLDPDEIGSLALAGPRMALENAVRFLTDHLEGDHYFPAHRPGHNLERARTQQRRVEAMLEAEPVLREPFAG